MDEDYTVAGDNGLTRKEREFTFTATADDDRLHAFSSIPSVSRGLLNRDDFELDRVERSNDGDEVTAVFGWLPMGAIKIGSNPRASTAPSSVVSNYQGDDESDDE